MNCLPTHPGQDPEPAAALYLSRLDHESLYSNTELRQAISETTAELNEPDALIHGYTTALLRLDEADDRAGHARRKWALRMAADLTRDQANDACGEEHAGAGRPAPHLRRAS
ncbi:hypothetical protein [Streptomyces sp. 7N604]|uniref:hypothetical protein n=1 Tax=Streptomyces sp. 7N604 TaxID=3457415 RepID=UPI003FD1D2AA